MAAEQETTRSPLVGSETTDYNTLFGERQEAKFARSTLFGKVRNIKRFSWVEWIFVVMASLSMLGVLGVIIERFIHFERHFFNLTIVNESTEVEELAKCNKWVCTTDFIFTMVLLLNLLFCAYYCYDGLFRERQFEMMSYAVATLVIVIYIIANYGVKWEEGQPIRLIRLVFACVLGPVNMVLAVLIWWRMGFLIFNTIGSNEALTRAYKIQSFFLTLQHFNLQVLVNIVALAWVNSGNFLPIGEKVILPILLVYALITMVIGLIAASFEVHRLSCVWYFLILPFFGYYVYKLTDVGVRWDDYSVSYVEYSRPKHISDSPVATATHFKYVGACLLIASSLGVIVCSLMEIFMFLSQRNFGKGLREKVTPPFEDIFLKCTCGQTDRDI